MSRSVQSGLPALRTLGSISLSELSSESALMSRVDRKYFVPRTVVNELIEEFSGEARVLEIDDKRTFTYETVYFDSRDFKFFRDHAQGKRHRYKVRVRTYVDSGLRMLEVKSKGFRGRTLKERIDFSEDRTATDSSESKVNENDLISFRELDESAKEFVQDIIGFSPKALQPVLTTVYRRSTLALGDQRITLDADLECINGEQLFCGPDDVLVETKSPSRASGFDAALKDRGIRPHSVSKYCVAASLLYPHLPRNRWNRTLKRFFTSAAENSSIGSLDASQRKVA